MSSKAERHAKRADAYAGYKPKSKKFYVIATTPPSGVRIMGTFNTHEQAAAYREQVQDALIKVGGNAFVKGEATLRRTGLI
jgi:hypothetical protein